MERMRQKLLFAASCLMCTVVCWRSDLIFGGTEFGSGSLAGDEIFTGFLFLLAPILAFRYPRAAAIIALAACVDSLPLYLYLVFPRPFRQVWPGQWKVLELPRETFIWDGWWITGILVIVVVGYICCSSLIRSLTVRRSADD